MSDPLAIALSGEDEVADALDAVEAYCEQHGLSAGKLFKIRLALDELLTNIVSYGFESGDPCEVGLTVAHRGASYEVEIIDNGKPFNPLEVQTPDLTDDIDALQIGGLGIKLVRTFADRLDYQRDGAFNRLQMRIDDDRDQAGLDSRGDGNV